jgi:hypothetical protein
MRKALWNICSVDFHSAVLGTETSVYCCCCQQHVVHALAKPSTLMNINSIVCMSQRVLARGRQLQATPGATTTG